MDEPIAGLNARNPWSWYAVVASRDLGPAKVMPIVLNGEHLVVWRSREGGANAWSDRCPHRGMRLSFGAVQREELICPYHGWTFGTDGHCIRIPAHPHTEPSCAARARIYPTVEAHGYVWVCIGEPAEETPEPGSGWPAVRSLHLPADVPDVTAALLLLPLVESGPVLAPDALAWSDDPSGVRIRADWDGGRSTVDVSRAGLLTGTVETANGLARYDAFFQPTAPGAAAIHLASPDDPIAMNRALTGFRHALVHDLPGPPLVAVRNALGARLPDQVQG